MNHVELLSNSDATAPTSDRQGGQASLPLKCLGVVVPVFNEARTINEVMSAILAQPMVAEVIVVDDASTDGTWTRLLNWPDKDPRVSLLRHNLNSGKGASIRTALPHVSAPVVIVQDADLEYDPADYGPMLQLLRDDVADVVYGSRYAIAKQNDEHLWHTLGNRLLTSVSNFASGLKLTDEATCYKMFHRQVLQTMQLEEDGFGFCPEVTAKISRMQLRIAEVPISYRARTIAEGKKLRWVDAIHALRSIIKYNWFR